MSVAYARQLTFCGEKVFHLYSLCTSNGVLLLLYYRGRNTLKLTHTCKMCCSLVSARVWYVLLWYEGLYGPWVSAYWPFGRALPHLWPNESNDNYMLLIHQKYYCKFNCDLFYSTIPFLDDWYSWHICDTKNKHFSNLLHTKWIICKLLSPIFFKFCTWFFL